MPSKPQTRKSQNTLIARDVQLELKSLARAQINAGAHPADVAAACLGLGVGLATSLNGGVEVTHDWLRQWADALAEVSEDPRLRQRVEDEFPETAGNA